MKFIGAYPFCVFIGNIFSHHIKKIRVTHHHYPTVWQEEARQLSITDRSIAHYSIKHGHSLGFSMYFAKEELTVGFEKESDGHFPKIPYYITVGDRALCRVQDPDGKPYKPMNPDRKHTKIDDHLYYYGGIYLIEAGEENPEINDWTLIIKKIRQDPEEDDVVIGPVTPG